MPTVLISGGLRFFFFSNERQEPPHIHVQSAENYAKFWLDPVTLADSIGFSASELADLRRIVEQNARIFEERWDEHFKH